MSHDGNGLYLRTTPLGSQQWIQRLTIQGRRTAIGLGAFPLVSMTEARELSFECRRLARNGGDPRAEKKVAQAEVERKASMPTFSEVAELTIQRDAPSWRGGIDGLTAEHWRASLERRAFPVFGDTPIPQVTKENVIHVVRPDWKTKPTESRKLLRRIRAILDFAVAEELIAKNPVARDIPLNLPKLAKENNHHRALPYAQVPRALETIRESSAALSVRLAFEFMTLTVTRSGETRGARWNEVNVDAATWTIPASRMKGGKAHIVPLSEAALAVLEQVKQLNDGSGMVFPSPRLRGKALAPQAFRALLVMVKLHDQTTPHGIRTCFQTWAQEQTDVGHAVREKCLAHEVGGDVERSYARSNLLLKRAALMSKWATFATRVTTPATVKELRKAG